MLPRGRSSSRSVSSTQAARTTFRGGTTELLPWWGGAAMVLVHGVALNLVGTFTTLRSDIT